MSRLSRLLSFLSTYSSTLAKEDAKVVQEKWNYVVEKLTDEQLHTGCEYVKTHDAQFIIPQRFIFVAHGLIDPELAYEQAKDEIYNHPAIYHAAIRSNLNKSAISREQEYNNFRRAYGFECDKVLRGEELQPIPKSTALKVFELEQKAIKKVKISSDIKNLTPEQHLKLIREKLGSNHKLVKTLEKNL